MKQVAIITGGSSGIGMATAEALAARGARVYELSRRPVSREPVIHITADVTDATQLKSAVEQVMDREGRIDILVNNAGWGISGAVEFTRPEDARRLFEVDFFGMVELDRLVIPVMRRQGAGRIVNISSVAAPVAIPFQAYYSAAKAAVNAYSRALRSELRPFGVSVCAVMPGDIASGFTQAREKNEQGNEIYEGRIVRGVAAMERDERRGMSPRRAGEMIARIALSAGKKPLYTLGAKYGAVTILAKLLPAGLTDGIVARIYR